MKTYLKQSKAGGEGLGGWKRERGVREERVGEGRGWEWGVREGGVGCVGAVADCCEIEKSRS